MQTDAPNTQPLAQSVAIDALKALGSQLIVLHHLSAYGPIGDALGRAAPILSDWLYENARMAVQIFLVVGGFLAAHALSTSRQARQPFPARAILARYLRLVVPYLAALALAIAAAALARPHFDGDFVPAPPAPAQLLSHALLANQSVGHEALSAGVWYVAIDLQLFAVFAFLVWIGQILPGGNSGRPLQAGAAPLSVALVAVAAVASLFWFNRDAALDDWAIYFFGAYGMGAGVYWAGRSARPWPWLAMIAVVLAAALLLEFRWRLVVALAAAAALALAGRMPPERADPRRWIGRLSRLSYALFLVHFPVILVASAVIGAVGSPSPAVGVVGALLAWAASLWAAGLLHRWVEAPAALLHRQLARR